LPSNLAIPPQLMYARYTGMHHHAWPFFSMFYLCSDIKQVISPWPLPKISQNTIFSSRLIFCFLVSLGFELRASGLENRCLSHTFSSFCFGYFEGGGLISYLPGLSSNCNPPKLSLLSN
jgi:hypothetical protein